ncbi:MAG: acyltransferase family protein [Actinomycetes bacterium]
MTSTAVVRAHSGSERPARAHLYAIDLVRVLTVALVVSVHTVSLAAPVSLASGALTMVLHTSREVFFTLTALVLMYGYGRGRVRWGSFWRRRYLLVVVPYVVWTVVYLGADGERIPPFLPALHQLTYDLVTGQARYQLYFLLVTMQVYALFPLLRALVARTAGHHRWVLVGAGAYQLGLTAVIWTHAIPGGVLGSWLANPDEWLPSYLGYLLLGAVVAWHLSEVRSWIAGHRSTVVAAGLAALGAGVGIYLAQVEFAGANPVSASMVFQPVVVVESVAVAGLFLLAGLRWEGAGTPWRRVVVLAADASFGVYLAHPLLLQGLLDLEHATGLTAVAARWPAGLLLGVLVGIVVPLVYAACVLAAELVRRTPASLPLTGRSRRRPEPHGAPVLAPSHPQPTPPLTLTGGS